VLVAFVFVIAVTNTCITIDSVTREDGSVDTEFTGEQRQYADDDFVPKEMKAGSLVLIHGEVRRQFTRAAAACLMKSTSRAPLSSSPYPAHLTPCSQVVHKSEANLSDKSRHAYTFHVVESDGVSYDKGNWLQYPEGKEFPPLLETA
jgi:hypothetical protein